MPPIVAARDQNASLVQTHQRSTAAGRRLKPSKAWSAAPLQPSPRKPVPRPGACGGGRPSSGKKADGFSAVPAAKTAADSLWPPPPRKHQAAPLAHIRRRGIPATAPRFRDRPPPCYRPPQNDVTPDPGRPERALALDLPPPPPLSPSDRTEPPLRGVTRNFTPPNGAELIQTASLCSHRSVFLRSGQPARRLPSLPRLKVSIERHAGSDPLLAQRALQPPWLAPKSPPMPPTGETPPVPLEAAHAARGRLHHLEKRNGWCSLPRGWRLQPAALTPQLPLIDTDGLDPCDSMCYHPHFRRRLMQRLTSLPGPSNSPPREQHPPIHRPPLTRRGLF